MTPDDDGWDGVPPVPGEVADVLKHDITILFRQRSTDTAEQVLRLLDELSGLVAEARQTIQRIQNGGHQ